MGYRGVYISRACFADGFTDCSLCVVPFCNFGCFPLGFLVRIASVIIIYIYHIYPVQNIIFIKQTFKRPSQGFWGFREKGYLFSGIWGEGSFIFRDLGRKRGFREQGAGG